mmetsp:Transcript_30483/g.83549  ORF Transcript_30483/g.83549 Transcript_30483/m.83549 type:complete len:450 (+) Transcript_30483:237-1586(+)
MGCAAPSAGGLGGRRPSAGPLAACRPKHTPPSHGPHLSAQAAALSMAGHGGPGVHRCTPTAEACAVNCNHTHDVSTATSARDGALGLALCGTSREQRPQHGNLLVFGLESVVSLRRAHGRAALLHRDAAAHVVRSWPCCWLWPKQLQHQRHRMIALQPRDGAAAAERISTRVPRSRLSDERADDDASLHCSREAAVHLGGEDAQREDVRRAAHAVAARELGRRVQARARAGRHGRFVAVASRRHPKVSELHCAIRPAEDVGGLHVEVRPAVGVDDRERLGQPAQPPPPHARGGRRCGAAGLGAQHGVQGGCVAQLHHDGEARLGAPSATAPLAWRGVRWSRGLGGGRRVGALVLRPVLRPQCLEPCGILDPGRMRGLPQAALCARALLAAGIIRPSNLSLGALAANVALAVLVLVQILLVLLEVVEPPARVAAGLHPRRMVAQQVGVRR